MINTEITPPLAPSIILRAVRSIEPSLNVVNMVDSNVSIDTHAAARLMAFDAEYTGLLYLRYFTVFTMARASEVNVYAAIAIVVIS